MVNCPICLGYGVLKVFSREVPVVHCYLCDGSGKVLDIVLEWMENGKILKERRYAKRLTLRKAAKLLKMNPLELSEMELGKRKPNLDIKYDTLKTIKT